MKTLVKIIFFGSYLFAVACTQSPKKANTNLVNNESNQSSISGDEITACQHASKIFWVGSDPSGEHNGFIKIKKGNYIVADNKLVGGEFTIDMNTIVNIDIEDAGMNTKLVNELKSVNFFNVDSFPEGKFLISKVTELDDEQYTHEITGNLTLKSITQPITFKANVRVTDGKVTATSEEFVINRTIWNINHGSKSFIKDMKNDLINDEIRLELDMHSM